jgi:hypothetical protein
MLSPANKSLPPLLPPPKPNKLAMLEKALPLDSEDSIKVRVAVYVCLLDEA